MESCPVYPFELTIPLSPIFGAGVGLAALGVAATTLRRGVKQAAHLARRRMLISLEIPCKDPSYPWFLEWMAAQTEAAKSVPLADRGLMGALRGKVPQIPSHELAVETTVKKHENGSSEALFNLIPGPGTHFFNYKGHWFQVRRDRDGKLMDMVSGTPWETVTITGLSSSRSVFPELLAEARERAEEGTEGKTKVYIARGFQWEQFGKPRSRRPMGSVVLADGVTERIEADLKGFIARRKWYAERGIPYRRGYMLHGPPGSGKTSFIQSLAGSLGYDICLLNLVERGLSDDKLHHLLGLVPERCIVLLEDVDSAFNKRVKTEADGFQNGVTFSGLLNALDGVTSSEERIIFMTTNHLERLDPALIRPGRVDFNELLDDAHGEQAYRHFVKFYGGGDNLDPVPGGAAEGAPAGATDESLTPEEIDVLAHQVEAVVNEGRKEGKSVSMASLQGHYIRNGPRESVAGVKELLKHRP